MNSLISKIITAAANIWGMVWPYSLSVRLHNLRNTFYSAWLCRSTRQGWKNIRFGYPQSTLHGVKYISIGEGVEIGAGSTIAAYDNFLGVSFHPSIVIEEGARLGEGTNISSINSVKIGRNVLFGRRVTVNDNNHGDTAMATLRQPPMSRQLHSKGAIVIGDNVWVGDKATILSGVTIGEGAVVGANSVVTRDVAPYTIVGGIPARPLHTAR